MQHYIIDQKLKEKNILFQSRPGKLISLQPPAKGKKQKSTDRQRSGIPDKFNFQQYFLDELIKNCILLIQQSSLKASYLYIKTVSPKNLIFAKMYICV